MIRVFNTSFPSRTVLLGVSEAFLVTLAFLAAMMARLGVNDASIQLNYEQGFLKVGIVAATFIICMHYFDLYDSAILGNRREVLARLIQVIGTVSALQALVYYVYPPLKMGRGIVLIGLLIVAVLLLSWRGLFLLLNSMQELADRTLIFGDGPIAKALVQELESRPELGLHVVGQISVDGSGVAHLSAKLNRSSAPFARTLAQNDLPRAFDFLKLKRIIVAMGDRRGKLPVELLLSLKSHGVLIQDGADAYENITGKVPVESLRLGWLLFSSGFHVSRLLLFYKRIASVLFSVFGLLLSLPLLPFIALAIKLTSPGRVFYKQQRIGQDGVIFACFKFRTMRADAEADSGPTWAGDDDPRITKVGRVLRTLRLDEIPQLWNVLKGDMSVVGPRPERPEFVESLCRVIPHYHLRETVRPGITGWAQVRYKYGSSIEDAKEKLRYDLFYIKNISPGLDFLILFETVKIILLGRGAK